MIRLFLFLFLFIPSLSNACVSGDTWSGTLALPVNTSPAVVTINGDSYDVVTATPGAISTDGLWQQYTGTWACSALPPPPDPVLCPDGTPAPSNDILLCKTTPPPDPDPNPNPTPLGEVAAALSDAVSNAIQVSLMPVLSAISSRISEVSDNIVSAKSFISQRMAEIASQSTSVITNAITQQTSTLVTSVSGVIDILTAFSQSVNSKFDLANTYLDHIRISVSDLALRVNEASAHITDSITAQTQQLMSGLSDVRTAVSGGVAWVVSAVGESGINTVSAINDFAENTYSFFSEASGFFSDSLDSLENIGTKLATMTSAIDSLPDRIANAIVTNEGNASSSINSALDSLSSAFDSLSSQFGSFLSAFNSVADDIHGIFDKAKNFFTGEESDLSQRGQAELNAGHGDNPLATPEEVDLSGIIKTTTHAGTCPAPVEFDVLQTHITWSFDHVCTWAEVIGKMIMFIAALVSVRIIAGAF